MTASSIERIDRLMHEHHSAVREEYKAQMKRIIWDSHLKHNLSSTEQAGIFREIVGEVMELEDRNKSIGQLGQPQPNKRCFCDDCKGEVFDV